MDIAFVATEYGFAKAYALPLAPFRRYERRLQAGALHAGGRRLVADPREKAPWANAIVALVYPYRPFAPEVPLSGNYQASNAAYHAAEALLMRLEREGVRAARIHVPVRELLLGAGLGIPLKNGLTAIEPYGTRFALVTLAAHLAEPPAEPPTPEQSAEICASCRACERACPSGAIDAAGYDFRRCARAYMGGDTMEPWVMDAMTTMLGCELCQNVCPYNCDVGSEGELPGVFALEKLLGGEIKPALALVGKNLNKNGRLLQHACVLAARLGRRDLMPLIERLLLDEREAVRAAAGYALARLGKEG